MRTRRAWSEPNLFVWPPPLQPAVKRLASKEMQRPNQRRDEFQTDALRPGALPSASLRARAGEEQTMDIPSEEYLNNMYEDWNKKVDVEIETLVDGMTELVKIAAVRGQETPRDALLTS